MLEKAPMIKISIVEGSALKIKEPLTINALGLINSMREDCEDHYVYFGSAPYMNGKVVNDVICSKED